MTRILIAAAFAAACNASCAVESNFRLKQAPGVDRVQISCSSCHSLDYIQLNSPFLDRKGWDATVTKMIKALGAPVKTEDIPAIVDYLAKNYGKP